jgi:predicted DNA-binding protein with PD1-like motif
VKYSEAKLGRVFVIRLEDGEIVHEVIEAFALEHSIHAASLLILGGADEGSRLVVGPENGRCAPPVTPLEKIIDDVHEVTGTGTIFPDDEGNPILHLHMACGRNSSTITGCIRQGVRVWHVMEVILLELTNTPARRLPDAATGFKFLIPG